MYSLRPFAVLPLLLSVLLLLFSCKINPTPPDRYAMVYGVSDYSNGGINSLSLTDDDARAVAEMLYNKGFIVHLRIDDGTEGNSFAESMEPATKDQLEIDLENFAPTLNKSDILLFYFSGHGAQFYQENSDEGIYSDDLAEFIVLYPTEPEPPDTWAELSTFIISDDSFFEKLSYSNIDKKIVILDSCHSGGFIGQKYDFDAIDPVFSLSNKLREHIFFSTVDMFFSPDSGDIDPDEAIVITAAGEQEFSYEYGEHGVFTAGLLRAPQFADYDHNDYIDTGEIYRYTTNFIEKNWNPYIDSTPDDPHPEYHPHISGGPVDFILFEAD